MVSFTKLQPVTWLEECVSCGKTTLYVEGEKQNPETLKTLHNVYCSCGQTGYIDVVDGNAFVCYEELSQDDLKYNKLKIMYDKAVELLMLSNYGDIRYLTRYGVLGGLK